MSTDQNENSDLANLRGAGEEPLLPLFMPAETGRHVTEGGEDLGGRPVRIDGAKRRDDPIELFAETNVLADQLIEFGLEVGAQPAQRWEMDLLLEREVRVERGVEAVQQLLHLSGIAAFERAQHRRFERVEVSVLARDAARLVGEAKAKSGLIRLRHVARNSTAPLRCARRRPVKRSGQARSRAPSYSGVKLFSSSGSLRYGIT